MNKYRKYLNKPISGYLLSILGMFLLGWTLIDIGIDPFWILIGIGFISLPFLYAGWLSLQIKWLELQIKTLSKQKPECRNCLYGVRKWECIGIPMKQVNSPYITCKKEPNTTEHTPHDWCGNFIPVKWK